MAVQTFASIYIGSYEVSMKIFEISGKKKLHELDHLRRRLELGRDIFKTGLISYERVEELCETLAEFAHIVKDYRIEDFEVCASSGIRMAENSLFVLDQIRLRTGFDVNVISNSEQRFITYQRMSEDPLFAPMSRASTVIMDVGGAGIQVSYLREGEIITTQFMDLGMIRLRSLRENGNTLQHFAGQLKEYIDKELNIFCRQYVTGKVDFVIFTNDYCTELAKKLVHPYKGDETIPARRFIDLIDRLLTKNLEEIATELNLSNDRDPLIVPSMLLFRETLDQLKAGEVWAAGINMNDGIAYNHAKKRKWIRPTHDFDQDVLSAARNMARHYQTYSKHSETLLDNCTMIFDAMKKIHGLDKRYRLLLQVAAILHNVGRYISIADYAQCGYNIIISSEIIGLTHRERQMVAFIVWYHVEDLDVYMDLADQITKPDYLVIAKLSAILRTADAMDQSHKHKFEHLKISVRNRELVVSVEADRDISLERVLFEEKTRYFENVFSIRPVLREKRVYNVKKNRDEE